MQNLIRQVNEWAESKDLAQHSTPLDQMWKMVEETQELEMALMQKQEAAIRDELGDVLFCALVQAYMNGIDAEAVLQAAIVKVTRRTGKMVNGMFVKDGY